MKTKNGNWGGIVAGRWSCSCVFFVALSSTTACSSDNRENANSAGGQSEAGASMTLGEQGESETNGGAEDGQEEGLDEGGFGDEGQIDMGAPKPETTLRKIDLLFVIDNSGSTGEEQANLARNFPRLIEKLINLGGENDSSEDNPFGHSDVQIMITTTDVGNPECDETTPEMGAPVTSSCDTRLDEFIFMPSLASTTDMRHACTDVCRQTIELQEGAHFLAFREGGAEHNIATPLEDTDITGDGMPEGPVSQALACLGPQGLKGCAFESPLEAMYLALDPNSEWNKSPTPFLREDALLAVALVTDEADCSIEDENVMTEEQWRERDALGLARVSSAICWNAGVECDEDPGNPGHYTACRSVDHDKLHSIERYTDLLVDRLLKQQEKEVVMLGILGVPEVTRHSDTVPKVPIEGGVMDLEYRDWRDPEYPEGDILPDDWPLQNADIKRVQFGIGPGCTGSRTNESGETEFIGQAIPPVRILEVCRALDEAEASLNPESPRPRCCIESICDDDVSGAIDCLVSLIESVPPPVPD